MKRSEIIQYTRDTIDTIYRLCDEQGLPVHRLNEEMLPLMSDSDLLETSAHVSGLLYRLETKRDLLNGRSA